MKETLNPPFTYAIKTMGCKANVYDSLVLDKELSELGGVRNDETPDVYVMNSCTVTNGADKQCDSELKALKRKSPKSFTLLTGCYAHVAKDAIASKNRVSHLVDEIVTNDNKSKIRLILSQKLGIDAKDIHNKDLNEDIYWGQLPTFSGKTRAFLKIQEGCNDYCTYCIIPFARGVSRSVKTEIILREIERLESEGVREVVLTGINIADYGLDLGSRLEVLIARILNETKIPRLRLSSLDPSEITDELIEMLKGSSRLMPHFHVSLQSPVSRVLRAMKRKYRSEEVVTALNKIYALNSKIFVGMDVITGFPSETEAEHNEAVAMLRDLPWTRLHVFPYSERSGTAALKIPGKVPMVERRRRAQELMELSHARHGDIAKSYIGKVAQNVLFEAPLEVDGQFFAQGHSDNYFRVLIANSQGGDSKASDFRNTIADVRVTGVTPKPAQDWTLEAEFTQEGSVH